MVSLSIVRVLMSHFRWLKESRELSRGKNWEQIVDVSQELTDLGQLQKMTMPELLQEADKAGIEDVTASSVRN